VLQLCCFHQFRFKNSVESQVFSVLVVAAFGLMLAISGGVTYLTIAEWRDRRRRERDNPDGKSGRRVAGKAKK